MTLTPPVQGWRHLAAMSLHLRADAVVWLAVLLLFFLIAAGKAVQVPPQVNVTVVLELPDVVDVVVVVVVVVIVDDDSVDEDDFFGVFNTCTTTSCCFMPMLLSTSSVLKLNWLALTIGVTVVAGSNFTSAACNSKASILEAFVLFCFVLFCFRLKIDEGCFVFLSTSFYIKSLLEDSVVRNTSFHTLSVPTLTLLLIFTLNIFKMSQDAGYICIDILFCHLLLLLFLCCHCNVALPV